MSTHVSDAVQGSPHASVCGLNHLQVVKKASVWTGDTRRHLPGRGHLVLNELGRACSQSDAFAIKMTFCHENNNKVATVCLACKVNFELKQPNVKDKDNQ